MTIARRRPILPRALATGLPLLLAAGCALLRAPGDVPEPPGPESSEAAANGPAETAGPRPAATPGAPVVTVLSATGIESELHRYRRSLAGAQAPALAASEAGYYLDVLEARLRQRLAGTDSAIGVERRGQRMLITLSLRPAFDSASATPRPETLALLRLVQEALEPFAQTLVSVHGHTDSTGAAGANQRLSERRALAVAGYLVERGIPRARVVAVGHGASSPLAANDSPEGQARNRRVELWIDLLVRD